MAVAGRAAAHEGRVPAGPTPAEAVPAGEPPHACWHAIVTVTVSPKRVESHPQ